MSILNLDRFLFLKGDEMEKNETNLRVVFEQSGKGKWVPVRDLIRALTCFFRHFCVKHLVEDAFLDRFGKEDAESRMARFLDMCGFAGDAKGFFAELLGRLEKAGNSRKIVFNGIELPHLLLMEILEVVLPGDELISIRSVDQLEKAANIRVPESDRGAMQEVMDTYPVRLSMHVIRQMRVSGNVAYQYLPFVEELDVVGHVNTWIGQFHQGLLEQMYQNRVIFLLNMSCPVYCRFCFRKHKESRNQTNPTVAELKRAVAYVSNSPTIKEIVITGGDPFLNRKNMDAAIDGLMEIEHVRTLRLATRSVAYYPHMFESGHGELMRYLKRKNIELQERGKRMEVATHFIHPDEISPRSLMIISDLVRNGIPVYVQTPFLNDCNDKGPELVRLFSLLRGAGAELHYIYIPCSPIHGNRVYWSPVSKGLAVGRYLRAHVSDRVMPRICTATPIGKMDWHTSGWAVEPVSDNENFMWIRSPYTPEYFRNFAPLANELDNIRVNDEGTIDIQYMARIGDESLFFGPRPPRKKERVRRKIEKDVWPAGLDNLDDLSPSIVDTGSDGISRVHETRVEIDASKEDIDLSYIQEDDRITDIVIVSRKDAVEILDRIERIVRLLEEIPHVNAVRLQSGLLKTDPEAFTSVVVDRLGRMNRLSIVSPQRLEIETRFISASEFKPVHFDVICRLNNRGITVYNNTPLLGGINDTPEDIRELSWNSRNTGIEFHHLYVAGLPIQDKWNMGHPVSLYDVVDIATTVRREGSGREIPRYVIKTVLGEVDFGLSSAFTGNGEQVFVKLLHCDHSCFSGIDPEFRLPEGVTEDLDGNLIVPVTGLFKETEFPLS